MNISLKKLFSIIYLLLVLVITSSLTYCSDESNPSETEEQEDSLNVDGYSLLWNDEFDGTEINRSNWVNEVNGYGGGNNELQYYTDREVNSFVSDGKLFIVAQKEEYTGPDGTRYYTSARMTTQTTKSFKYGLITARIKLPYGQGIWPAFWMLGISFGQIGWPACGEIDIMEMVGGGDNRDNVTHGTLHWDDAGHKYQGGSKKLSNGIFADDFHEFSVIWDEEKITWLLDGEEFYSLDIIDESMSEFHEHYFIILNIAVGGNWPGDPTTETVFPQEMTVDYVRVYQKEE